MDLSEMNYLLKIGVVTNFHQRVNWSTLQNFETII